MAANNIPTVILFKGLSEKHVVTSLFSVKTENSGFVYILFV